MKHTILIHFYHGFGIHQENFNIAILLFHTIYTFILCIDTSQIQLYMHCS